MRTALPAILLALSLSPGSAPASGLQTRPGIAPDGAGGAWLARHYADGHRLRHVAQNGLPGDGEAPSGWGALGPGEVVWRLVPDGSGGVFVLTSTAPVPNWPNPVFPSGVLVRHLQQAIGPDPGWPTPWLVLSAGAQNAWPLGVADGAGGLFVAWTDFVGDHAGPHVRHVFADGTLDPAWMNTEATFATGPPTVAVALLGDGAGGVWLSSMVSSDPWTVKLDRFVASNGAAARLEVVLPEFAQATPSVPALARDGGDGVLLAWSRAWSGGPRELRALHVLADRSLDPAWPEAGFRSGGATGNATSLIGDGRGGGYLLGSLDDQDHGASVRHFDATGRTAAGWPESGVIVSSETPWIADELLRDDAGGVIVLWTEAGPDLRSAVRAWRLLADGRTAPGWAGGGLLLGSVEAFSGAVADGAGGILASFPHAPSGRDFFVHVSAAGTTDVLLPPPPTSLAMGRPYPQPTREAVAFRIAIPTSALVEAGVYDVAGRIVRALATDAIREAGEYTLHWDGQDAHGAAVRPGVYLVRVLAAGRSATRRVVVTR